jgi:hypothetical protein
MSTIADRVKETFTTTGTGDLTLLGAVSNHQTAYEAQGLNEPMAYCWIDDVNEQWETGLGQNTTATNFERTTVKSNSSGTTDLLDIGSGTKVIICSQSAVLIDELFDQSVASGASPNFTIANLTLDATDLEVAEATNLQTFAEEVDDALRRARGTGISTSYVSTATAGGTTFDQPAVKGEITSDEGYFRIVYAGATGVTIANLSATSTWVYIDKNSALQQQTTTPTRQDRTRKAFVMRIGVNVSSNEIIGFEYENNPIGHYANSLRDLYEFLLVQGVPFKKDQIVTGRTDNIGFDVSAGSLLEFGGTGDINNPNIKSFDLVSNVSYNLMSRTAFISSETNLPKVWDNAGSVIALGSTTFAGHRLYRFSSGNFAIQYGQGNYANINLARAGVRLEDYVLNPTLKDATFFGWWLVALETTATSGVANAEFVEYTIGVQGGSSSGLSGAALRGNNGSDFTDAGAFRTNIALGTADSPTFAGLLAEGDVDVEGLLKVGVNNSVRGKIVAFGNEAGSVNGGELSLNTAVDYNSVIGNYFNRVIQDDYRIETNSDVVMTYAGGDGSWEFNSGTTPTTNLTLTGNAGSESATFAGIVDILGGTVKLNGATISGIQVIIADDAVAELTFPNRSFGMLNLTEGVDGDNAPRANVFFSGYVDFGPSPSIDTAIKGSFLQTNSVDTPTGSTGTDGRVTIFVAGVDGTLYIENRDGASRTFNINLV